MEWVPIVSVSFFWSESFPHTHSGETIPSKGRYRGTLNPGLVFFEGCGLGTKITDSSWWSDYIHFTLALGSFSELTYCFPCSLRYNHWTRKTDLSRACHELQILSRRRTPYKGTTPHNSWAVLERLAESRGLILATVWDGWGSGGRPE